MTPKYEKIVAISLFYDEDGNFDGFKGPTSGGLFSDAEGVWDEEQQEWRSDLLIHGEIGRDARTQVEKLLEERDHMDSIHDILDGEAWSADHIMWVAEVVERSGRSIAEPDHC